MSNYTPIVWPVQTAASLPPPRVGEARGRRTPDDPQLYPASGDPGARPAGAQCPLRARSPRSTARRRVPSESAGAESAGDSSPAAVLEQGGDPGDSERAANP